MRRFLPARRGVVVLLALIVALGGGMRAYRAANPAVAHQSADERAYAQLAISLAHAHHFGSVHFDPFHWPPGAPIMFAVGDVVDPQTVDAAHPDIPAAYWLQFLVGTAAILATFALAALVAGERAGLVAALIVAIYPPLVRSTGELLSEPLGAFLLTATLLVLARAWTSARTRDYGLAGVLFGLTILTRADFLLLPFLLALVIAFAGWRRARRSAAGRDAGSGASGSTAGADAGSGASGGATTTPAATTTPPAWWRGPAALALGAALLIAPWSIFASVHTHGLVAVTDGDAPALFVGTFLAGDGTTGGMKTALFKEIVRKHPRFAHTRPYNIPAGIVLDTVAARHPHLSRDSALRKEAFSNIGHDISHPIDSLAMVGRKLARMWGKSSRAGSVIASHWTRTTHLILVIASILALLTAVVRLRDPRLIGALIVLSYSTALHALVVAKPRYNLPLMPLLICAGVSSAALLWARRRAAG